MELTQRVLEMEAHIDTRLADVAEWQTRCDRLRNVYAGDQARQLDLDRFQSDIDRQRKTWRSLKERLAQIDIP